MRILALAFCIFAGPAVAHELWIAPEHYQVSAETNLEAHLVNGQNFGGVQLPYLPRTISRFVIFAGDTAIDVENRIGSRPALNQPAAAEGLNVVGYISNYATVSYAEWEKFQSFVEHKDLGDVLARHQERGLPMDGFSEAYLRFSKSLIGVGSAEGADRRLGMETELVALNNPYLDSTTDEFAVQLFYRRDVRANEQIEVFEKAPDGTVEIAYYRTDDEGIARFPVKAGYEYMVDAVVLREPAAQLAADSGSVWETLWANLTFAVPE